MEALYQSFMEVPISTVKFQGLIQTILVAGALIFKFVIPAPKKKTVLRDKRILCIMDSM